MNTGQFQRKYTIDSNAFDVIDKLSAYWWGFIYADGCIDREKSLRVKLSAKDTGHIIALALFLKSDAPIKLTTTILGDKAHEMRFLYVTDRHLCGRLMELGVVKGRTDFYNGIAHLPDEYKLDWVRGLFDGDGSVDWHCGQPRLRICGHNDEMEWVAELLGCNTYLHKKSGMTYVISSGRKNVERIAHILYDDAYVYMHRKRDLATRAYIHPMPRERNERGRYK